MFLTVWLESPHPVRYLAQVLLPLHTQVSPVMTGQPQPTLKLRLILGEFILTDPIIGLFGAELVLDILS